MARSRGIDPISYHHQSPPQSSHQSTGKEEKHTATPPRGSNIKRISFPAFQGEGERGTGGDGGGGESG